MSNHPTGDTALSRAITTGAPVATNDKQAAELTQSRPTPGGEWSFQGSDIVYEGKVLATAFSESVAYRIVRELNAADAMEQAVDALLDYVRNKYPDSFKDDRNAFQCPHMRKLAALRGGA